MMIRELERPTAQRVRVSKREGNPLRRTAAELNDYLGRLSEAVRSSQKQIADSVDDSIEARNKSSRRFKIHGGAETAELPISLDDEQAAALALLKEARILAADAGSPRLQLAERDALQARFQDVIRDYSQNRAAALAPLFGGEDNADPLFSLATHGEARAAYSGIDGLITKFFTAAAPEINGANAEHEMAVSASQRLRDFLINEGPANAFARFREINRSNVLGLLQ